MSDEIILEGKQFVSAKRASEISGYARDYVGQLARSGLIGAQRVGGLWYVSMESLTQYQKNADLYTPTQPQKQPQELDSIVSFDGKDYISASKAAKLTSYHQDYVGQLARAGKILSRQIGNRWYVEREGLLAHKAQKDSLLAAVQTEAVGLTRTDAAAKAPESSYTGVHAHEPLMTYIPEGSDLMPLIKKDASQNIKPLHIPHAIPIRVVKVQQRTDRGAQSRRISQRKVRLHENTMSTALKAGVALTFVIVLSYGLVSLKDSSVYTTNVKGSGQLESRNALTASVGSTMDWLAASVEKLVTVQLNYVRTP